MCHRQEQKNPGNILKLKKTPPGEVNSNCYCLWHLSNGYFRYFHHNCHYSTFQNNFHGILRTYTHRGLSLFNSPFLWACSSTDTGTSRAIFTTFLEILEATECNSVIPWFYFAISLSTADNIQYILLCLLQLIYHISTPLVYLNIWYQLFTQNLMLFLKQKLF